MISNLHFLGILEKSKERPKIHEKDSHKSTQENAKNKCKPKIIVKNTKIFKHANEKSIIESNKEGDTENSTVFVDTSDNDSIRTVMEVKIDKDTDDNKEIEKQQDFEEEKEE